MSAASTASVLVRSSSLCAKALMRAGLTTLTRCSSRGDTTRGLSNRRQSPPCRRARRPRDDFPTSSSAARIPLACSETPSLPQRDRLREMHEMFPWTDRFLETMPSSVASHHRALPNRPCAFELTRDGVAHDTVRSLRAPRAGRLSIPQGSNPKEFNQRDPPYRHHTRS